MARLLDRLRYRLRLLRFALAAPLIQGGEDPPADDPPKGDPPAADPPKDDPPEGDPPEKVTPDDDWQTKARKHERETKRLRKQLEERDKVLKDREDEQKTETQKAIDKAREEGKAEALTEAEKDRRADRLEVSVTRLASKGISIGEGEDAKTVRFADSEDALLHVERGISRGDIESEDIYDSEGKVNTDALTTALGELLKAKPHLAADGERPKPTGDADTRKGDPAQKDLESMTPEDHARRKYGDPSKK